MCSTSFILKVTIFGMKEIVKNGKSDKYKWVIVKWLNDLLDQQQTTNDCANWNEDIKILQRRFQDVEDHYGALEIS